MRIANLKIGTRLACGFGLVLALLAGVALMGLYSMARTNDELHHIVEVNDRKIGLLETMSSSTHIVSRVLRTIALLSDEARAQKEHRKIDDAGARYDAAFAVLEKMPLDAAGKQFVAELAKDQAATRVANGKFAAMAKADRDGAVAYLLAEAGPMTSALQDTIDAFIALQKKKSENEVATAEKDYQFAKYLMLTISTIAVLLGAFSAWFITRSITQPIGDAVRIAQTVATGDLTSHIEVNSTDETGQLLLALQAMNASLVSIVGQVRSGTDTIATASGQIASGNLDLSTRTEEQASSLEETASSMEELTATVKQNADNARQANAMAISAAEVARKGGDVVARVVDTMGAINASSRKIVDIISVIDGIAFQTNILALNAAVEAARAGEQGRGFAVVASEVRNLAQRSATAAKEIKSLIDDSVEKVDSGARLVDEAGTTMHAVVSSIKNVTDIMGEITAASHEQTAGIEQINEAVTQMDQVTQQNAALVEEAAAAAASLQDQAAKLAVVVGAFTISGAPSTSLVQRPAVRLSRSFATG
jgi:methyl-accepting chemotaxis protein